MREREREREREVSWSVNNTLKCSNCIADILNQFLFDKVRIKDNQECLSVIKSTCTEFKNGFECAQTS